MSEGDASTVCSTRRPALFDRGEQRTAVAELVASRTQRVQPLVRRIGAPIPVADDHESARVYERRDRGERRTERTEHMCRADRSRQRGGAGRELVVAAVGDAPRNGIGSTGCRLDGERRLIDTDSPAVPSAREASEELAGAAPEIDGEIAGPERARVDGVIEVATRNRVLDRESPVCDPRDPFTAHSTRT